MHVTTTEIEVSQFDNTRGGYVGFVTFTHECHQTGDAGCAHFQCLAKLPEGTAPAKIRHALLEEACRQVNFMPEYRLGQRTLTFREHEDLREAG